MSSRRKTGGKSVELGIRPVPKPKLSQLRQPGKPLRNSRIMRRGQQTLIKNLIVHE